MRKLDHLIVNDRGHDGCVVDTAARLEQVGDGRLAGTVIVGGGDGAVPEEDLARVRHDVLDAVLGQGDADVPALGVGRQVECALCKGGFHCKKRKEKGRESFRISTIINI